MPELVESSELAQEIHMRRLRVRLSSNITQFTQGKRRRDSAASRKVPKIDSLGVWGGAKVMHEKVEGGIDGLALFRPSRRESGAPPSATCQQTMRDVAVGTCTSR